MPGPEPATQKLSGIDLLEAIQASVGRFCHAAAKWMSWLYFAGLVFLLMWLEFAGERLWITGILLFAPPQVLLLPLVLLTPFCLMARPRSTLWHLLAVCLVAVGYMSFRWHPTAASRAADLTIVTHNIGQGYRPQFYDFIAKQNPDVVVMQDARNRARQFARQYPDKHVAGAGEFLLVSRWPIQKSELVAKPQWNGRPVAARFELMRGDAPLIIYSVHLPTPRHQLNRFLSGRALAKVFSAEDGGVLRVSSYSDWTALRLQTARELAHVFQNESMPFIVAGDFNTPDHGMIYRLFARHLVDAHLVGGNGWGLTFPGSTRNPLSGGGPWLRIDYAFAGKGWRPTWSTPEPGRRSQHCAVAARFALTSE